VLLRGSFSFFFANVFLSFRKRKKKVEWKTLAEEAPLAYKDVDEVIRSVELAGLSKAVVRLTPLGVAKG